MDNRIKLSILKSEAEQIELELEFSESANEKELLESDLLSLQIEIKELEIKESRIHRKPPCEKLTLAQKWEQARLQTLRVCAQADKQPKPAFRKTLIKRSTRILKEEGR